MIPRPNFALDAPPASLEVGGVQYPVDVDYRTWISIMMELDDWMDDDTAESAAHNTDILRRVQCMAFGGILADEDPAEVLEAVGRFAQGYPGGEAAEEGGEALLDFGYDLADIIIAIRNQTGIDLSYRRREAFHWWEFLLEVRNLCGEHRILRMMQARGYRGDDPEMNRLRRQYALPKRQRAGDAARMEEINRLFYNS